MANTLIDNFFISENARCTPIIVEINAYNFFSTGNIILGIAETARKKGFRVITYSPAGKTQKKGIANHRFIGSRIERAVCVRMNYLSGHQGGLLYAGTKKLLKELDELKPDIIHLHNLHNNYVNVAMLFNYIKSNNIKIVWTLHDCWAFTGHCPYFDIEDCEKWKTHCNNCPMYRLYPATFKDNSSAMFDEKKKLFTGVSDMIIVSPSQWLADLVGDSFLKNYPVRVINNGIDLRKFYPRESDFRKKHHLEDKFLIMGCSSSWGQRKGIDRFEAIADKLGENYKIILVGIDGTNVKNKKIFCIRRTTNQDELAEIYSTVDAFLNPTREENFPTVNIEALACGTPVLSFGAGGSAEAFDEKSGMIVNDNNVIDVLEKLREKNFDRENCIARGKQFNQKIKYLEYVELYKEMLEGR